MNLGYASYLALVLWLYYGTSTIAGYNTLRYCKLLLQLCPYVYDSKGLIWGIVRISTVTYSTVYMLTAGTPAGSGQADIPAGGGQADNPAGATL